jgi:hypothetical protein
MLTPHTTQGAKAPFSCILSLLKNERSAGCFLLLYYIFIYYQEFWITMTQKVAVITGSHKGLDYAIAFMDEVEQLKYIHHRMTVAY